MVKLIQQVELDAIKEFQKICKENNIDFFLRGGSVLGAVKYDGFIPWDDDMDIAVPREGYDRLPEIFKDRIIAGKYQVLAYQYCDTLHCYFPRLFLLENERKRLGLPHSFGRCSKSFVFKKAILWQSILVSFFSKFRNNLCWRPCGYAFR